MKRLFISLLLTVCTILGATAVVVPKGSPSNLAFVQPVTIGTAGILPAPRAPSFNPPTYRENLLPLPMASRDDTVISRNSSCMHALVSSIDSPQSPCVNGYYDHHATALNHSNQSLDDQRHHNRSATVIIVVEHSNHAHCPPEIIILIIHDPDNAIDPTGLANILIGSGSKKGVFWENDAGTVIKIGNLWGASPGKKKRLVKLDGDMGFPAISLKALENYAKTIISTHSNRDKERAVAKTAISGAFAEFASQSGSDELYVSWYKKRDILDPDYQAATWNAHAHDAIKVKEGSDWSTLTLRAYEKVLCDNKVPISQYAFTGHGTSGGAGSLAGRKYNEPDEIRSKEGMRQRKFLSDLGKLRSRKANIINVTIKSCNAADRVNDRKAMMKLGKLIGATTVKGYSDAYAVAPHGVEWTVFPGYGKSKITMYTGLAFYWNNVNNYDMEEKEPQNWKSIQRVYSRQDFAEGLLEKVGGYRVLQDGRIVLDFKKSIAKKYGGN